MCVFSLVFFVLFFFVRLRAPQPPIQSHRCFSVVPVARKQVTDARSTCHSERPFCLFHQSCVASTSAKRGEREREREREGFNDH